MGNSSSQPNTIKNFDPKRYEGTWWEIARYPNPFQEGCARSSAKYRWNQAECRMRITNKCYSSDDQTKKITGFATIPDPTQPGKLLVTFPHLPSIPTMNQANYWVHWTDYDRYSIVGNGNRSQLWILSREKSISCSEFQLLILSIQGLGYNPNRLIVSNGTVEKCKREKSLSPICEEKVEYYGNCEDSEDPAFWISSEKERSKNDDEYKNKSTYASDFSEN